MKKMQPIAYAFAAVISLFGFQQGRNDKPGFTITVNGDQFKNQTFFIPPANTTYANLYMDFKDDPKAKRTELEGYTLDNSLRIHIGLPIHKTPESFTFIEDSIPSYMEFAFEYQKKDEAMPSRYVPGRITVNITKYGNVGDFIEGNFSGELNSKVKASGTFKVTRIKDRF